MTLFLRILMTLCSVTTAAHFLRFGTLWDALPVAALAAAAFFPRLLPRPVLILAAAAGALLWADQAMNLVSWRMNSGMPWMRLALILGAVCLAHLTALMLLLRQTGARVFGPLDGAAWVRTATALVVVSVLLLASDKARIPLLMGERFFPGSGIFWICAFALYGSLVAGWLLNGRTAEVRSRIWTFFRPCFSDSCCLALPDGAFF